MAMTREEKRESKKVSDRKYRESHREERREVARECRKNNKDYARKYRESHQDSIRDYAREHYKNNQDSIRASTRKYYNDHLDSVRNSRRKIRENHPTTVWFKEYKATLKCTRCPESRPYILDFHHLDSAIKTKTIATMVHERKSKEAILAEIAKCIVLCRNCHGEEHHVLSEAKRNRAA